MSTSAADRSGSAGRPASVRSNERSPTSRTLKAPQDDPLLETTPLFSRRGSDDRDRDYGNGTVDGHRSPAASSLLSIHHGTNRKTKAQNRTASLIALAVLCFTVLGLLGLGFAAPAVVEEYVKEAVAFDVTSLSVDSLTATGARAKVQGTFLLDASQVQKKSVSNLGRFGTWIVKEIETGRSEVKIYLPAYNNLLLGVATLPSIKVNIRNGNTNLIDLLADLTPGDIDGIRLIANDWLDGRLGSLTVRALATVPLKSGIFSLGTHQLSQSMTLEGQNLPAFPKFDIESLKFDDDSSPGKPQGMVATASISVMNDYPVRFDFPSLSFDIMVPNCQPGQDYLFLANAKTSILHVRPKQPIDLNVTALVPKLRKPLITTCPRSDVSPLDAILADYLKGKETTVYVQADRKQDSQTPAWLIDIIQDTVIALPLPGHPFEKVIRKFSLAKVHFGLPDPWAEPGSPKSNPRVSAVVNAIVGLPKNMDFNVDVDRVRANASIFHEGEMLGVLDLSKWQNARTSKGTDGNESVLIIQSDIDDAPLNITDEDVFADLLQSLIFDGEGVTLGIKASVDVNTKTVLGNFVAKQIPADGQFYVKPLGGGGFGALEPRIDSLEILDTTKTSLKLKARANITNPTDYSAHIPYINFNVLNNDTVLGSITAEDLHLTPGKNVNLIATALWDPSAVSGKRGSSVARNFISQYISGMNTTITLKSHKDTIPSQPALGIALSKFELVIDTPKPSIPDPPVGGGGPKFIRGATMHLISSTATFDIISPLPRSTLYITDIQAVALYNHTIPVGWINHDLPFAVPPGNSTTPRLPVKWQLGGAGYDAVKDALGGTLKLDARANASVKIDNWEERLWFKGGAIGAHVRL